MLRAGVDGMSIQDIVAEAAISRGTLYRYFSSKTELLDAYTDFMRARFNAALQAAMAGHHTPDARLEAFLAFFDSYLGSERARGFLEAEPGFALDYFRRSFGEGVARARDALAPVFDHWSERLGKPLDHQILAELVMRILISHALVPAPRGGKGLARRLLDLVAQFG